MTPVTETELIDYLAGELPPDRVAAVEDAVRTDPDVARELTALRSLFAEIGAAPDPTPSTAADRRFERMLAAAAADKAPKRTARVRTLAFRIAAIAAAVLLVFTAGRFYEGGGTSDTERQLAATRALMLELMQDGRTSARIKATTVTFQLAGPDPVTTDNLGYLLRTDDNANVRLAALDALQRFIDDPGVRDELLGAMDTELPPVVRIELIETLVRAGEKRVLPYLDDVIEKETEPQEIQDLARIGSLKLI